MPKAVLKRQLIGLGGLITIIFILHLNYKSLAFDILYGFAHNCVRVRKTFVFLKIFLVNEMILRKLKVAYAKLYEEKRKLIVSVKIDIKLVTVSLFVINCKKCTF